jgi:hypothetical protein
MKKQNGEKTASSSIKPQSQDTVYENSNGGDFASKEYKSEREYND